MHGRVFLERGTGMSNQNLSCYYNEQLIAPVSSWSMKVVCFSSSLLFSAGSSTLWQSKAMPDIIYSYWPSSHCSLLPISWFTPWLFISLPLCLPGQWDSVHFFPPCQHFQWKWGLVSTSANVPSSLKRQVPSLQWTHLKQGISNHTHELIWG